MGCSQSRVGGHGNWNSRSPSDEGIYDDYRDSDTDTDEEYSARNGRPSRVHWDDPSIADTKSTYTTTTREQSARVQSAYGRRRPMSSRTTETDLSGSRTGTLLTTISTPDPLGGTRAPSLSLWYDDNVAGDILTQDMYVPAYGLTKNTHYCCLQWNSGKNGGGYCGLQDHDNGRNYIFTIWDPVGTMEEIRPVYMGPGTICEPFGDSGTGLKSYNFSIGWDPDKWYRFVMRRWDQEDHTFYGLWIKHMMDGVWYHMVTIDFPMPSVYFDTWTCSFLEDWEGTGNNERRVHFKNGYKRRRDRRWVPFDKAVFGLAKEKSCKLYEENYDSGTFDSTFYLQSGGCTLPSDATEEEMLFKPMEEKPDNLPLVCYLTSVTEEGVEWEIPDENVPQFSYMVIIDGEFYEESISSEARACAFEFEPTESVELIIEDIYGRLVRVKYHVQEGMEMAKRRTESGRFSARM